MVAGVDDRDVFNCDQPPANEDELLELGIALWFGVHVYLNHEGVIGVSSWHPGDEFEQIGKHGSLGAYALSKKWKVTSDVWCREGE